MKHFLYYLKLVIGSAIFALGFSFFLYPEKLVGGGITGISQTINLLTGFPVGIAIVLLNIPIFITGFRKLGIKFMLDSLLSTVLCAVLIDIFEPYANALTTDPLLAAIAGGAIDGIGLGIVFSSGATTGGSDIVAKLVRLSRPDFNMGQILLAINILIVGTYAILFRDYERALYAFMAMAVSSYMLDAVLYGLNYGKLLYIISEKYEEIGREVIAKLNRGATILNGKGAYSGSDKSVIIVAIKSSQILVMKNIVKEIDPSAFVIVTETKEVLGLGFEKISQR